MLPQIIHSTVIRKVVTELQIRKMMTNKAMSPQKLADVTFFTTKLSPPSQFVSMVLKQLDIQCNVKEVDFLGGEHKTPEFLAINPAGKVPTLKDGDLCLGESRAIACYLCNKYAPNSDLYPKSPEARAKVDEVLYADLGFINAMYEFAKPVELFFHDQKPDYADDSAVKQSFSLYEAFLANHDYLSGDHLTLADLSGINSIAVLDMCFFNDFSGFPRLKKWIERVRSLPYYDDCTGSASKEFTALYQAKLKTL